MVCAAATVDALKLVADTDERLGVQHEERRAGELLDLLSDLNLPPLAAARTPERRTSVYQRDARSAHVVVAAVAFGAIGLRQAAVRLSSPGSSTCVPTKKGAK